MEEKKYTSLIRLRMSAKDAHYGGNLVDGAHMVHLFGDVATELLIQCDGDEGLFCAYNNIEFKAPVYASASLTKSFHTSKKQPCPPCGRGCFFAAGGPHKFRVVTARPLCYNTTILYRVKLRRRFYLCAATT